MAFLSTDNNGSLAISVNNCLQVFNIGNNSLVLEFINESTENISQDNGVNFICHVFLKNGSYFGAVTENKKLLIWKINLEKSVFNLESARELPKRPTWLTFLQTEKTVIVADKYGDIYKCALDVVDSKPVLILGHLSMVLTVCMGKSDRYIISGDRDEKIRVSRYPNAYSIHSYCLGHKKLVSCLEVVSDEVLISTSADKTLKLWEFFNGKELYSFDLTSCINDNDFVPSQLTVCNGDVCLICEKSSSINFFRLLNNEIQHVTTHTLNDCQPLSVCTTKDGGFVVVTTNRSQPIRMFAKTAENTYIKEKENPINSHLTDLVSGLPKESLYLWNLIKPVRGKRDGSVITPEATIDYESPTPTPTPTNKARKLDGLDEHTEE